MKKLSIVGIAILAIVSNVAAQADRWQQHIDYKSMLP